MSSPRTGSWFALFVLLGINTLNFFDRQIPGVVGEPMRIALGLDDLALGWINTAFILLYAVVGLPLGRLADVTSRKWILTIGVLVWSALTACSGLAAGFWSLFFLRVGVGVGEASCAPAANSLLGDLFPVEKRSRAVAIFMLGLPLGLGLSALVSGHIAQGKLDEVKGFLNWIGMSSFVGVHLESVDTSTAWRLAFLVPVGPGVVFALLTLFLPEPVRGAAETHGSALPSRPGNPLWVILRMPTMWWIILSGALHNFCMYTLGAFLSPLLQRYYHVNVADAGKMTALVYGIGGLGLTVAGWASDRFVRARAGGRLEVATGAVGLGTVAIGLALFQGPDHAMAFASWMLLGYFLLYFYYAGVYASIQDIVEPGLRGTAMGVYFFAMYLLGGAAGPALTGWLSRTLTARAEETLDLAPGAELARAIGLHDAMLLVPALGFPLMLVLFAASRCISRDRAALHAWQSTAWQ